MNNSTNRTNARSSVLTRLRAMSPRRGLATAEALRLAELQATELLQLSRIITGPVPLQILSDLPRVQLEVETDLPSSGMSYWDGEHWRLVAKADEHPHRQRFSLVHEYKHVIDHPSRDLLYPDHRTRELAADHFAACVLMPRLLITRAWCSGEQDVDRLADQFDVSPAAMERRLLDLGHLEAPRPRRYICARGLRSGRSFAIAGTTTTLGATP